MDPPKPVRAPPPPPFVEAMHFHAQGLSLEALRLFEKAMTVNPDDARARSYFALLLAVERGQVKRAVDLAELAISQAPDDTDLYQNLSAIHVKGADKGKAIDALRRGLQHRPDHEGMRSALEGLGVRRAPVLPFLPRSHFLNKYLGIAAHRLKLR